MKNKDLPAMPLTGEAYIDLAGYLNRGTGLDPECLGMTKREMFAKDLACAYLSGISARGIDLSYGGLARKAIAYADALLDALDADVMLEGE